MSSSKEDSSKEDSSKQNSSKNNSSKEKSFKDSSLKEKSSNDKIFSEKFSNENTSTSNENFSTEYSSASNKNSPPTKRKLPQEKEKISNVVRKKRSVVVSDRKVRSADVGVSSLYEVISEADLAFSPDNKAEAVTVFQGKIREEVVYGICMPVPGFSVLFVMIAVSAVVSALVAGSLLYRYQIQREQFAQNQRNGALPMSFFVNWMGTRITKGKYPVVETSTNGAKNSVEEITDTVSRKTEDVNHHD